MEIKEITKEQLLHVFTANEKNIPKKIKNIEHDVHTLLGVLDMRAYTEGGQSFEWLVDGVYRETVTEMLITKLKKLQ